MTTESIDRWPESNLEVLSACDACGEHLLHPKYNDLFDIDEGVTGKWNIVECLNCGSLLLNPRPNISSIGKAYRSYYTHSTPFAENSILSSDSVQARIARGYLADRYNLPRSGREYPAILAKIAWPLKLQLDYFMRNLPKGGGRLLDIGCGSGGFLQRATMAGWDVEGIEPDPLAAEVAKGTSTGTIHSAITDIDGELFDVITLSHVIEHVHQPSSMLKRCFDLLRPSGVIWIATPNIAGTGHRIYEENWQALEIPRHLVMPSAAALKSMLKASGFSLIRFHRRGRGSAKRFKANYNRCTATRNHLPSWLLAAAVDTKASISPLAGEELIVCAVKQ